MPITETTKQKPIKTTKDIENLKPADKRREIPVAGLGGLYFLLQTSGSASWAIRYRSDGRLLKYTLGGYPKLSLRQAKTNARQKLGEVDLGGDPQAAKIAERKAKRIVVAHPDRIESIAVRFLNEHVRRNLRVRTIAEVERHVREIVAAFKGRRLGEIKRADIRAYLGEVSAEAPVAANHRLSWFKRLCSWAVEQDLLEVSPAAGIKPPTAVKPRARALNHDEEIKAVWQAAERLGYPYGDFIRMMLLTGARRSEIAEMPWRELDLARGTWTLPAERAKNEVELITFLPETALDLLRAIPRNGDYVFSFTGANPFTDFARAKRLVDAMVDIPAWRFHDLRPTARTQWSRLRIEHDVREALLNHAKPGLDGTYDVYKFQDEKAAALALWARELARIVDGDDTPSAKVIPLHA